jgi:transglutaminase-like putative cysteine protease
MQQALTRRQGILVWGICLAIPSLVLVLLLPVPVIIPAMQMIWFVLLWLGVVRFRRSVLAVTLLPFILWWVAMPPIQPDQPPPVQFFIIPAIWLLVMAMYHVHSIGAGGHVRWVLFGFWGSLACLLVAWDQEQGAFGIAGLARLAGILTWSQGVWVGLVSLVCMLAGTIGIVSILSKEQGYLGTLAPLQKSFVKSWLVFGVLFALVAALFYPTRRALSRVAAHYSWNQYQGKVMKGFNAQSRLGEYAQEWNTQDDDQILLRVWGASPGYLQGGVFGEYRRGIWKELAYERLYPWEQIVDHGLFAWDVPDSSKPSMYVYPDFITDRYFVPQLTHQVGALQDSVLGQEFGSYKVARGRIHSRGYMAFATTEHTALQPIVHAEYLQVPSELHSLLDSILQVIHAANVATITQTPEGLPNMAPEQWVRAIKKWYGNEFTYKLEGKWSIKEEPLVQFVRKKTGYCEYFASLGALLLRRAGVHAVYVKGFSPGDKMGDHYVVRRANAHAWVLYYSQRGWLNAEFTPPDFRPQISSQNPVYTWFSQQKGRVQRWYSLWREGQWRVALGEFEKWMQKAWQTMVAAVSVPVFISAVLLQLVAVALFTKIRRRSQDSPNHKAILKLIRIIEQQFGPKPVWQPLEEYLQAVQKANKQMAHKYQKMIQTTWEYEKTRWR